MATIKIPPVLRASVGGEKVLSASGDNVGDVLRDLAANHPATESQLFGADGALNRYVNVYLNDEDVRVLDGLDTAVGDADTLVILPPWPAGSSSQRFSAAPNSTLRVQVHGKDLKRLPISGRMGCG
jgi:molybdopterin synthase sulfur carrier subunit